LLNKRNLKMLYTLAAMTLPFVVHADDDEDELELGEMLDFVELNIATLLQYGDYPAVYGASIDKMQKCGCSHGATKIMWGSEIGLQCTRLFADEDPPEYDEELCGGMCNNLHNIDSVLFCPGSEWTTSVGGWNSDCGQGCRPPADFGTVDKRIEFWEHTLNDMLLYGTDYLNIDQQYLKQCACMSKPRPIRYGSKIGFDCVMEDDADLGEGCNAASMCKDELDRRLVTFCPAGHKSTCAGCEKVLEDDSLKGRMEWMVHVVEGLVQLSLPMLNWSPLQEQVLGCACKRNPSPIQYGSRVGYSCVIHDAEFITPACGANVICQDTSEQDIIHMCPRGYEPSCEHGCMNPVLKRSPEKEDL